MLPKSATSSAQAEQQNMDGQRAVRHIYFMFFSQFPPLMEFRSRLVTAQVQAACRPFFCKNKIGNSWLTNAAFHGILIDVDGALAQLVAHNTGSVGVRSSNLLCSTIICLKTSVFRLFSYLFLIHLKRKNKDAAKPKTCQRPILCPALILRP